MRSWDIFCRVVDNYGDVGVCWRLARQLAGERGDIVRLWIDDLTPLARIWPGVSPYADRQQCAGVDIRHWPPDFAASTEITPHDVVIEAFACETPPPFIEAMSVRVPHPVWINLEYLSAETWVEDCHLLRSPHPRLPLVKRFFFPGFTERTGGLLREAGLLAQRDAFRADADAQQQVWSSLRLDPPQDALKISLFAYPNLAAEVLLAAWAGGSRRIFCVVPDGVLSGELQRAARKAPISGETVTLGNLTVAVIPFVTQTDYDRLLWACDFNFVRGEDSFVRAQWAGRPFVWHIYPQDDATHLPKLRAFVDRYVDKVGPEAADAIKPLFNAWNGEGNIVEAWTTAEGHLKVWNIAANHWSAALAARPDMASTLAEAVEILL